MDASLSVRQLNNIIRDKMERPGDGMEGAPAEQIVVRYISRINRWLKNAQAPTAIFDSGTIGSIDGKTRVLLYKTLQRTAKRRR